MSAAVSPISPTIRGVLGEARQVYVAVNSERGPHVTPELFAWAAGRIWFAAATTTLKARVLRRRPEVGLSATAPGRSVSMSGVVEVFDPRRPLPLLRQAVHLPELLRGLGTYTTRNAVDLLAFAGDTVTGRLGKRVPPLRVLYSVRPTTFVFIENDNVVSSTASSDDRITASSAPSGTTPTGGVPAVAALPGPTAVAGRWFADQGDLHLPAGFGPLLPAESPFPISVVTDDYRSPGPAAKVGVLARGTGQAVGNDGRKIRVVPDDTVEWSGVTTVRRI